MSGVPIKRLYNFPEVAAIFRLSRNTVYRLFPRGELVRIKQGRRTMVRHEDLMRYINSMPQG